MKKLLMIAALFLLAGSVHAGHSGFPGQCQENYLNQSQPLDFTASQAKVIFLYLSDNCLPEPAYSQEPLFYKLLQRENDAQPIITIKAGRNWQKTLSC